MNILVAEMTIHIGDSWAIWAYNRWTFIHITQPWVC